MENKVTENKKECTKCFTVETILNNTLYKVIICY